MMNGFWKRWLDIWLLAMLLAGAGFALSAFKALEAPVRIFYDVIYWPMDGQSAWSEPLRASVGILGAVFIGMILFFKIAVDEAHRQASHSLWRRILGALLAWYVIDSTLSVLSGIPMNALSNTLILASGAVPFLASGVLFPASTYPGTQDKPQST
jgi:hypothetical protein